MKATARTSIALMAICFTLFSISSSFSQGRGRGTHNDNDRRERYDRGGDCDRNDRRVEHHYYDRRDNPWRYDSRDRRYDSRRRVDVYHHAHRGPVVYHRPAPVTRVVYYPAPRYVYYNDYNVYYDCNREVYIFPSGPRWIVSVNVPVVMHGVDRRRIVSSNVDYYDDDFTTRLEHHEYEYGRRR